MKAPDLYAVDTAQLAEEMQYVDVVGSMQWGGDFTIISGVRFFSKDSPQPILIIKSGGSDPMHLIALVDND